MKSVVKLALPETVSSVYKISFFLSFFFVVVVVVETMNSIDRMAFTEIIKSVAEMVSSETVYAVAEKWLLLRYSRR